jgi:hypothetical protein
LLAHNRFVGGGVFFSDSIIIIDSARFLKNVRIKIAIMAKTNSIFKNAIFYL